MTGPRQVTVYDSSEKNLHDKFIFSPNFIVISCKGSIQIGRLCDEEDNNGNDSFCTGRNDNKSVR